MTAFELTFLFCSVAVLVMESRALHMLGKHPEPYPQLLMGGFS